jgi:fatty-acyl-CoA synthase
VEGYGLTEGTLGSCLNPLYGEKRIGSIGLRFPHQRVEVAELDDAGRWVRRCEPGEPGHVCIAGPNVFPGYLAPEHNQGAWADDGLFNTGDLGHMDADGYVWLSGRAKDVIIRGGHNIDPAIIEEALCLHPSVAMAAAIGRPDVRLGEVPQAFVQLRPGHEATVEELAELARARIPERAAVPAAIRILESLPLSGVGKISKPHLRVLATEEVVSEQLAAAGLDRAVEPRVGLGARGVEVALVARGPGADAALAGARRLLEQLAVTITPG